jgi:hypothetical protein
METALDNLTRAFRAWRTSPNKGRNTPDHLLAAMAQMLEHMQRILQFLALRSRAKARMRVELLDRTGKTVAEVWSDYGILRRMRHADSPGADAR